VRRGRRGQAWRRLRRFTAGAIVATVIVGCALFYVWTHLQVVNWGYRISSAADRHAALEQTNRELRIEVASLRSPGRIESIARRKLGLDFPSPGQVVVVTGGPPRRSRAP
jgi:cell division protein FtsL